MDALSQRIQCQRYLFYGCVCCSLRKPLFLKTDFLVSVFLGWVAQDHGFLCCLSLLKQAETCVSADAGAEVDDSVAV